MARREAEGVPKRLKDPLNNRPVTEVPAPVYELLGADTFWGEKAPRTKFVPQLHILEDHLLAEGLLTQELMLEILQKAKEVFQKEPNLVTLKDPITIVGDIHGQYYDLRQLLELGGSLDTTQFLFLGDYVDRGSFSIEVITFLLSLKIAKPGRIRMLRGNHESRQMTQYFNFREECEYKYDVTVYDAIMECFDCLPVAAVVNSLFLCVHGGLSPELKRVDDIQKAYRFEEPPEIGMICDILWSDPKDEVANNAQLFIPNDVRGCAWYYTYHHTAKFLKSNHLLTLVRAHEVQIEGYKMHKKIPKSQFPSCITVFSAPNYCDTYGNRGAVLMLENSTLNVRQFYFSEHPYHLPSFMNAFEWSLPFMAEKVTEMLALLLPTDEEPDTNNLPLKSMPLESLKWKRSSFSEEQNKRLQLVQKLTRNMGIELPETAESDATARERMRQKAKFLGKMARVYRVLREENENIVKLKGVTPGSRMKPGLLLEGREKIRSEVDLFHLSEQIDKDNEKRPECGALPTSSITVEDLKLRE